MVAQGESQRKAVNVVDPTRREFDAVLHFDAAFRDPAKPTRMAAGKQMGMTSRKRCGLRGGWHSST